jgi:glutamate synthase (NADPH/NADH) large chain
MPHLAPQKQGLYDPANEHENCGVGFIAHIKGKRSHKIVSDALIMLQHMDHRGACGCEANTGDGAGIMTALPTDFLREVAEADANIHIPEGRNFGAGNIFLPRNESQRARCKKTVGRLIEEEGLELLGWRRIPTDPDGADIGHTARVSEPIVEQIFVAAGEQMPSDLLERKLYLVRKQASHELRTSDMAEAKAFYICTLSTKVMVYKGMLTSGQVPLYYPDLQDERYTSHLAMVHSRFSTNTFPSWDRAQPCRFMSHNGEINTLRGNKNWMFARQGVTVDTRPDGFGDDLEKLYPVVEPDCSDSGTFDNVLEYYLMTGRTLQEAVMMMIPEAWQNHETMSINKRAFYEYHSCLQEPWDGPASVAFTDGKYIGAVLDRNGLRPSRYYITHDDLCVMASEVGVIPEIDPANVKIKGRLQPGRMFLIDFDKGRLIPDEELKEDFATRRPYGDWLNNQRIELNDLKPEHEPHGFYSDTLLERMQAFGYTIETIHFMLKPMIVQKRDPVGSMGNDAALAVLSDNPRMIYDYFKQLFAQVTNPAIDSIREEMIMSLETYIGPEGNLLETTEQHAHRLLVPHPILTNEQLAAIKHIDTAPKGRGWRTKTIDITWDRSEGDAGLAKTLNRICEETEQAIEDGYSLVVLSDRAIGPDRVACSSLLATGAVHHHLVNNEKRTQIGIVVETGEAREVHHFCLLVGYGADAINPYLALEALWQARRDGILPPEYDTDDKIVAGYRKARRQGHAEGDGQDGHLHAGVLQGRADFRSGRVEQRCDRSVFRRHRQPHQGRGHDRARHRNCSVGMRSAIHPAVVCDCPSCPTTASSTGGRRAKSTR